MKCAEVQEQLSAFHDGELASETRNRTSDHLENCSNCGCALVQLEALTGLVQRLSDPAPPIDLWQRIENELSSQREVPALVTRRWPTRRWRRISAAVVAVSAVVFVAVGWYVLGHTDSPQHHVDRRLTKTFGQFVDRFQREPDAAEQILLTTFAGRRVSATHATTLLKYQPIATRKLPLAYSLDSVYVLEMPCCRCPQTVYRRDTGGMLAIFEHEQPQPVWFGERPQITANCGGIPARLVQLDAILAATWQYDRRYLTVIGINDVQELAFLIDHFRLLQNRPLPT